MEDFTVKDIELESRSDLLQIASKLQDRFEELSNLSDQIEILESEFISITDEFEAGKGCIALLKHEKLFNAVEEAKQVLQESYFNDQFSIGICDVMFTFWRELHRIVSEFCLDNFDYEYFQDCYQCLRKNRYISVCMEHNLGRPGLCIHKQFEVKDPLILVGESVNVCRIFEENEINFTKYSCINEIYTKEHKVKKIDKIIMDLDSVDVNPFLFQSVATHSKIHMKVAYLVGSNYDLIDWLGDIGEINFSFTIILKTSPSYKREILNFARS